MLWMMWQCGFLIGVTFFRPLPQTKSLATKTSIFLLSMSVLSAHWSHSLKMSYTFYWCLCISNRFLCHYCHYRYFVFLVLSPMHSPFCCHHHCSHHYSHLCVIGMYHDCHYHLHCYCHVLPLPWIMIEKFTTIKFAENVTKHYELNDNKPSGWLHHDR